MGDFFFVEEDKPKLTEDSSSISKASTTKIAPAGYIPITLSSLGKLSCPKTIHVSDYTGKDQMSVSMSTKDNEIRTALDILRKRIYEDIDVEMLHAKELEEILAHMRANFWSTVIENVQYPYTKDELKSLSKEQQEAILSGKEKPRVDIPISAFNFKEIPKEFKEPFTLKDDSRSFTFRLERIKDTLVAESIIKERYAEEERGFAHITSLTKRYRGADLDGFLKGEVGEEQYQSYVTYIKNRTADWHVIKRSQSIVKVDGEELDTLEKQIEAYDKIPALVWSQLKEVISSCDFGSSPILKVESPFTHELVERRFSFRLSTFLPPLQSQGVSKYTVVFGE